MNLFKYICALLLFGFNGVVASHISLNSYEIVFFRTFIGSITLIAIFLLTGGRFHFRKYYRDYIFVAISGMAMGGGWLFLYEAYKLIGVGLGSLLYYCGPVIVMALSPLLFKERLTVHKILSFITVLAGLYLVNGKVVENSSSLWGVFCGLMSAVLLAVIIISNKQSKKVVGLENSAIQIVFAFLVVSIYMVSRQGLHMTVNPGDWPYILFIGIVSTGLGCYLYFSPMDKLPVQTLAFCGYLEPLSAVVFAAIFLGERLSPLQILGAALIIGGAMMGELGGKKDSNSHEAQLSG